jgi:DNA-binding MarR family transcriptional regulator
MADETDELEPALAFLRELWALNHALESTSRRMHDAMGITAQQRMLLRFVGKFPEQTASALAALLHIEKSTLSQSLKKLEARDLVATTRDANDARRTRVVLTARGKRFDRPQIGTVERAVARTLGATASRDRTAVRRFLQRLVASLEDGR